MLNPSLGLVLLLVPVVSVKNSVIIAINTSVDVVFVLLVYDVIVFASFYLNFSC